MPQFMEGVGVLFREPEQLLPPLLREPGCLLQMGLDTAYWTAVNQLFLWGSLAIYFIVTFTLYSDGTYQMFTSSFPFVGMFRSCKKLPLNVE